MRVLDDIPFEIDPEAVFARLHLDPAGQYASEVNALIEAAGRIARPRALYKQAVVQEREPAAILIADVPEEIQSDLQKSGGDRPSAAAQARFPSRVLRFNLDQVDRVFAYVATCGHELDSIQVAPNDIFGQFCRDTIKEMALFAAISHLYVHVTETHDLSILASMNPGSGEASVWPIEQQKELFGFLGGVQEAIGVRLTESCLMIPNKSVSGILYHSHDGFQNCQLCRRERCDERRAPFDPDLWARTLGEAM